MIARVRSYRTGVHHRTSRATELLAAWPKGCAPPGGYVAWHEWAEAQGLHGLTQGNCTTCGRYKFPQELNALGTCADQSDCAAFFKRYGKVRR